MFSYHTSVNIVNNPTLINIYCSNLNKNVHSYHKHINSSVWALQHNIYWSSFKMLTIVHTSLKDTAFTKSAKSNGQSALELKSSDKNICNQFSRT